MGGKEGTRGYLYQAMVSVLNSVVNSDWKYVQLEPDTAGEKVDIKWGYKDGTHKAVQVKSSINNFSKNFILEELKKLIKDAPEAKEYSLLLIGSCDKATKEFINKMNKKTFTSKELNEIKISKFDYQKIYIQLENFNPDALKSQINVNLNKFLAIKKISANFFQLEQITGSIIFDFMESSIIGKEISKDEFEQKLLEWTLSTSQLQLTSESSFDMVNKMLVTYKAKIDTYIKESKDTMSFNIESDNSILKDSLLEGFFEDFTWRSKIEKGLSNFYRQYNNDPYIEEKNIVTTLQKFSDLNLTYPEFQNILRTAIQTFLYEIPDTRKASSYRKSLIEIIKLLDNKYNKVLIITGESGSGKTQLINNILANYNIKKELEFCSIGIPLSFNDNNIEKTIIRTLNKFFDTSYETLLEFNHVFNSIEDCLFKVFFIIDDLQKICLTKANFYKDLKEYIQTNTVFDWIYWIVSINEFDQYLILDNSNFLRDYCYYENPPKGKPETDLSNIFINMQLLNSNHSTFEKIFKHYKIKINDLDPQLAGSTNTNNIEMFRNNPLMCHVYANTAKEIEIEFMNICYFDFIRRYAEIKKESMLAVSKRNLSHIELKEVIEQDIATVTDFIIENKKLSFKSKEFGTLFNKLSDLYYELRTSQLVIQKRTNIIDSLSEDGVKIITESIFTFKLYWAFKILTQYREENTDWESYSELRNSFVELRSELLIYELLYLDLIKNHDAEIEVVIKNVLREKNGKEVLFFVFIKMSFESQAILFKYLINDEKIDLNRTEIFGLLYFLSNTMAKNVKVPEVFVVLNKYLDNISENNLGLYLESIVRRKLDRLDNFNRLKKCISQFIFSKDDGINKEISKIAAVNFYRVVNKQESSLDNIIKQIITYLKSKSREIEESSTKTSITFIEYFLRYLFTYLIENSDNKMGVHEILRSTDDYFLDEIKLAHILRRSVSVSYGYLYRKLKDKGTFKKQYLDNISRLIDSGNILLKKLAFHFIVDTLHNYKDPNTILDNEFIQLLKRLHEDKSLEKFNTESTERRIFFERNLAKFHS